MTELWSAQQHSWLAALGHEVLVLGALPETAAVPLPAPRVSQRASPGPRPSQSPVRASRPPGEVLSGETIEARTTPRQTTRMPDRLHFALIRASGCNPNAPGSAQLIAQWPTAVHLRGNPAAKRALWPQLRALRKHSLP